MGGYDPTVLVSGGVLYVFSEGKAAYSPDDKTLKAMDKTAPWSERKGHSAVVYDEEVWVMGGEYRWPYPPYGISVLGDVWRGLDEDWQLVTPGANWRARSQHTSVVFNDRIWVLGGVDYGPKSGSPINMNDIRYTEVEAGAGVWERYR